MPTTDRSPQTQRIFALDFTKGALVLLMVFYHWINYFIGPQWPYYPYLRFLTPSFIFITGFMVSNVYLAKYDPKDPRLVKRLFTRGLKLMLIFILLNVARVVLVPVLATGVLANDPLGLRNLFIVFVSGNLPTVGGKLISFSILVPISYLLMLSGFLMLPYRFFKYTFHVVCGMLLLSIVTLAMTGARSLNLEYVTIGIVGVLIGFLPMTTINDFVRHRYILGFSYLCYVVAITVWNVPFLLLIVGVCLSLMGIYLVGIRNSERRIFGRETILLGRYSLFGYISQIVILQILAVSLRHFNFGIATLIVSFAAAFALTALSVELVDRMRTKTVSVDRLYKAVFA
jgi:peptidoglycan/LPS O-acetylase OafA/YrhL